MHPIEIARQNVERRSPPPKTEPVSAGIYGAAISGACILVFSTLAGFDTASFSGAFALTVIIGFLVPFVHFRSKHSRFHADVAREYMRLTRDDHAHRT